MTFLTADECSTWLKKHGHRTDGRGRPDPLMAFAVGDHIRMPSGAGRRIAFIRNIWRVLTDGEGDVLLWVADWNIWPSSEHLPLFMQLRRALGSDEALERAPGCVVTAGERDDGLSILLIAALFGWDCWVVVGGGRATAVSFCSHDEFIELYGPRIPHDIVIDIAQRYEVETESIGNRMPEGTRSKQ